MLVVWNSAPRTTARARSRPGSSPSPTERRSRRCASRTSRSTPRRSTSCRPTSRAGAAAAHRPDPGGLRGPSKDSRRAAQRSRPDLLPRPAVRRDRAHRRLPGRHREDARLPRPPPLARAARASMGRTREGARAATRQHEHRTAQELLPWYVNGTLAAAEAAPVEAHLAQCPRCQADASALAAMRAVPLDVDSGDAVERGWAALRGRLDARPTDDQARQRRPGWRPVCSSHLPRRPSSCWSWRRLDRARRRERALSRPGQHTRGGRGEALAVFRPDATEQQMRDGACVPPVRASSAARRSAMPGCCAWPISDPRRWRGCAPDPAC